MALSVITIYMASILPAGCICINMLLSPCLREKRNTEHVMRNTTEHRGKCY